MRLARLFIPGNFEDAQLYMGHLVAFTAEREVRVLALDNLAARLEVSHPDWKGLLQLCFARNDWMNSGQFEILRKNERLAAAMDAALDEIDGGELALEDGEFYLTPLGGFEQEADLVLDTALYGRRIYLGTTQGLFDYEIDWQQLQVERRRQRHEARCVATNPKYGSINASCEEDGLFTGFDEFGWRGAAEEAGAELEQTAPRSLRTSWYGEDLVNYESSVELGLMHATIERVEVVEDDRYGESSKKLVEGFAEPSDELKDVVDALRVEYDVPEDAIQFVWNSTRAFFVNSDEHGFFTVVRTQKRGRGAEGAAPRGPRRTGGGRPPLRIGMGHRDGLSHLRLRQGRAGRAVRPRAALGTHLPGFQALPATGRGHPRTRSYADLDGGPRLSVEGQAGCRPEARSAVDRSR